ncbi:MAG: hypothetical protein LBQ52_01570 [Helicobacteraceae bacterium]|jgi:hypothetical protein|nr:hypothetical protein [Helicobacteraceae bacterium]
MDFPFDTATEAIRWTSNSLFLFRNRTYKTEAPPHYHIGLPPLDNNYVLLAKLTSQKDKLKRRYEPSKEALSCLIPPKAGDLGGFVKSNDTVIDCNDIIYHNRAELPQLIVGEIKAIDVNIPKDLFIAIANGIKLSPFLSINIQEAVDYDAIFNAT